MTYFELTPAYGADYRTSKEVKQAWAEGKDFQGDYQLQFKTININDIPKPCTVLLRYFKERSVATVEVKADATAKPSRAKITHIKTWTVVFGSCRNVYYTEYHAEQFMWALRLNGTKYRLEVR